MTAVPILANTRDLAEEALKEAANSKIIFYDTETSGLDFRVNHAVGYVIKGVGRDRSFYIPVRHAGGGNLPGCHIPQTADGWRGDLHWFEIELAKIAKDPNKRWVGHYLLFDMEISSKHGIELYGDLECTQANGALVNENLYSYSLEALAQYEEVTAKKGDALYEYLHETFQTPEGRKSMEFFWKSDASRPEVWEYAAGDDITTEEVWASQQKTLDEEELRRVWGVECRLIRTLYRMKKRGVRIDPLELERVHEDFGNKAKQISKAFPEGFKSNAPLHLRDYLADVIDEKWPRNGPTRAEIKKAMAEGRRPLGALKFDEKTLLMTPKGRDIVDARKLEHAQSSFTAPMMKRHMWKGRVHTIYNQMNRGDFGTISGRLSSSNPNLQQVPKRNKLIGPAYRRIFLPEEGHYWDTNDYKQQEYVVFTDYCRDPNLVAGYSSEPPIDIHQSVADMLSVERDPTAKRMNLGMLYGMGVKKLAFSLGVSLQQAQEWMDEYHRRFPSVKGTYNEPGFLRKAEARAKDRGFVRTYLGRRRRFDRDTAYKAGNGIIQGSSADVTKLKMVEVDEYFASEGDEAYLMLQVHDSLDNSIPIGKEYLADEARRIMTSFGKNDLIQIGIPMRVDAGRGPNWSVATYGEAA